MPTTKNFTGTYQLSCKSMTLKVELKDNIVTKCPPPVASHRGGSVFELIEWMRTQGGDFKMLPLAKNDKPVAPVKKVRKKPPAGLLKSFRMRSEKCEQCPLLQGDSASARCIQVYTCPSCKDRFSQEQIWDEWECYSDGDPESKGNDGLIWVCPTCSQPCKEYKRYTVCPNDQPLDGLE